MIGSYSYKTVDLYPDLKDPSLVGAWMMDPVNNTLVDLTSAGNDGTITMSTVEQTILGPMRRYLPNSGAAGSSMGAAHAFALNDITVSFWFRNDLSAAATAWLCNYYLNVSDAWGPRITGGNSIQIYDDIDNAGAQLYATAIVSGKLHNVVVVMDSLENLLYLDGVLIGSGTSSSDDWSSMAATLYHGDRASTGDNPVEGILGPLFLFNTSKDQSWVTEQYLKGAQAIPFKTEWGVPVSVGNETSGWVGNDQSPF